jgi:hypothetical protein
MRRHAAYRKAGQQYHFADDIALHVDTLLKTMPGHYCIICNLTFSFVYTVKSKIRQHTTVHYTVGYTKIKSGRKEISILSFFVAAYSPPQQKFPRLLAYTI